MFSAKEKAQKILDKAGITINGPNDFDIQVHNEKLYRRVLVGGSLASGESYMDGWWDVKSLDQFVFKILTTNIDKKFDKALPNMLSWLRAAVTNMQSVSRAFEVGQKHYDIGNDLYEKMLDSRMVYSCGYWLNAENLEQAEAAKLDLICRKIGLKKGDRILDIGCGFGSFLKFAAEKYGVAGVGITVSKNQAELAREKCQGLSIEILVQDYRNLKGQFDHIVSVGMFEHVGVKNYRTYFKKVAELLKDDGLFLLHTIGWNTSSISSGPWIEKYIFPNGMLPSVAQIAKAAEGLFIIEDLHNFGADYDKTLMAWFENFETAWADLKKNYSEKFYRMWKYYMLFCAGMFRARQTQLWQVVLSKKGVKGGYTSAR